MSYNLAIIPAFFLLLLVACTAEYSPKPKEYPHIELPARQYERDETAQCPFTFERHANALVYRDTQVFDFKPDRDCWLNIVYPDYGATIYLSYKNLQAGYSVEQLREDAYRLTYQHTRRADYIEPYFVEGDAQVFGVVYDVGGDAASATQFFLTDTLHHWLRGALYFNVTPNFDSLAPVIRYINDDIIHLIETLQWTD